MAKQLTVNLPSQKAYQHLLKHLEIRNDIRIKSSNPNLIQVRTIGGITPWIHIKISMFGKNDNTRLTISFSLYKVYIFLALVSMATVAFIWILPILWYESLIFSVLEVILFLSFSAYEIHKSKSKFIDDIKKIFEL